MRYPNPTSYTGPIAATSKFGQVRLGTYQPGITDSYQITINQSPIVAATFTGFTTAPGDVQAIYIHSNLFKEDTLYQVTLVMQVPFTTDARLTITKIAAYAGYLYIVYQNLGPQALAGPFTIVAAIVPPYVN